MTSFGPRGLLIAAAVWVVVLIVGIATGNTVEIVVGAVLAAGFAGAAVAVSRRS